MKTITEILGGAQVLLDISFDLQRCFEETLTDHQKTFLHMLRCIEPYAPMIYRPYAGTGRKSYPYLPYLRSQFAKIYFQIETTTKLIERLNADPNLRLICGFERVPARSSFSRAFEYLSRTVKLDEMLGAFAQESFKGKVVYHINRDSSAIHAREKALRTQKKPCKKQHKKRGRPAKTEINHEKQPTAMQKQVTAPPEASLEALNKQCSFGCKKNSQGNVSFWKGYKLHLDVSDCGFPITACVTGANVHDSMLAIPMEKTTEQRVVSCYSLMDSAYDAKTIKEFIASRQRLPIIAPNKRTSKHCVPLDPAKQERYKIRTTVEQAYAHLKDNLIPKALYVKGYTKVAFVLFSAVICLAALKHLQSLC